MPVASDLPIELETALRRLSGDLHGALVELPIPTFILDTSGQVRWLNAAAVTAFGDQRGMHYTAVVASEGRRVAEDQFARKVTGTVRATAYEATVVTRDGERFVADIDTVRLEDHGHVVGVFGVIELEHPAAGEAVDDARLTPRQLEVLQLLAGGYSTKGIAARLHIAPETVRNHVRGVLRALHAHSRLEAVARARALRIL
jgi:PAS domain S-box-containing protein